LQTNNGLCEELLSVPMLIATGSCWFVAESVHLGNLKAIVLEPPHKDTAARGTQVDGHIAAHHR